MAFMRMRSPRARRRCALRDGSMEMMAILELVVLVEAEAAHQFVGELDLPAPPVPVIPIGT